jgi:hypothetical protein
MAQVNTRPALITAAYAPIILAATAQQALITGYDVAMNAAATAYDLVPVIPPFPKIGAKFVFERTIRAQMALRVTAAQQIAQLQVQRQALIDEARLYAMSDATLGRNEPADSNLFVVAVAPDLP